LRAGATADKVGLTTERPPEGLFEPSGEILVEHEGEEILVAKKELKDHLGHGDEILILHLTGAPPRKKAATRALHEGRTAA
jgi:hypothetical protein